MAPLALEGALRCVGVHVRSMSAPPRFPPRSCPRCLTWSCWPFYTGFFNFIPTDAFGAALFCVPLWPPSAQLPAVRDLELLAACEEMGLTRLSVWILEVLDRPADCCEVTALPPEAYVLLARKLHVTYEGRPTPTRASPRASFSEGSHRRGAAMPLASFLPGSLALGIALQLPPGAGGPAAPPRAGGLPVRRASSDSITTARRPSVGAPARRLPPMERIESGPTSGAHPDA